MDSDTLNPQPPHVPQPPHLPQPHRFGGISRRGALLTTTVGLAIGGFAGGYVISHAATSNSSASTAASPTTSTPSPPAGSAAMPPHGSSAHESAETAVTGANATKAQAAAVKYVGSGTAGAVTTDFTKTGYEVTVTKSDGSAVEVHMDSSFNVMQGPGGPGGPPPGSSANGIG